MQKGPVLLPSLHLPSDRQQAGSLNLKPSDVHLSSSQSSPTDDHKPKAAVQVKGILKKTSTDDGDLNGGAKSNSIPAGQTLVQNGQRREKIALVTAGEYSPAPRSTAPWRQRVKKDATASSQRSPRPASIAEECLSTLSTRDGYDFFQYAFNFGSNRGPLPHTRQ